MTTIQPKFPKDIDPHDSQQLDAGRSGASKGGRRWFLASAALATAAALTGAVASQALGQDGPPWHRGFMGGPFHMDGPLSPTDAADRADRMARHLAIEIDASAEQQDKLRAVAKAAVNDLLSLRERAQAAREQARGLLTAPTVDRTAIETFRTPQMALADEASRRIAKALDDLRRGLDAAKRMVRERCQMGKDNDEPSEPLTAAKSAAA